MNGRPWPTLADITTRLRGEQGVLRDLLRAGQFRHFTTSRAEATPAQASLFEAA